MHSPIQNQTNDDNIYQQLTRAALEKQKTNKHSGRLFSKAKNQHYDKTDRQRLLCEVTKESAINTGSAEEQTLGKEAM